MYHKIISKEFKQILKLFFKDFKFQCRQLFSKRLYKILNDIDNFILFIIYLHRNYSFCREMSQLRLVSLFNIIYSTDIHRSIVDMIISLFKKIYI